MGSSHHLKRLAMPRSWPLPRKTSVWVQKPDPCGHSIEKCMPMGIILRDIIGVAHNRREAKKILHLTLLFEVICPKSMVQLHPLHHPNAAPELALLSISIA